MDRNTFRAWEKYRLNLANAQPIDQPEALVETDDTPASDLESEGEGAVGGETPRKI